MALQLPKAIFFDMDDTILADSLTTEMALPTVDPPY